MTDTWPDSQLPIAIASSSNLFNWWNCNRGQYFTSWQDGGMESCLWRERAREQCPRFLQLTPYFHLSLNDKSQCCPIPHFWPRMNTSWWNKFTLDNTLLEKTINFYSCKFHNFCRETVLWSVHSTPSTGCSGGESHCGPRSIGWWLTRDTILTVSHQEHAFGNNITSFHLAPKVWPLCNVFSLHLFKGNWLKDSCASHIEHCPCSTINLCQAKTQYKAALRKVSKLVVSDSNFVFKISNDPRRWVFLLLPPFFPCLPTCQSDRKCIQHPNCVFSHLYPGWQILTTKTTEYLDFIILVANFKYILLLILNFLHDEECNLWWCRRSYKTSASAINLAIKAQVF